MYWLKIFVQIIILPPTSLVLLALAGGLLWPRRVGRLLIGLALMLYVVLSIPAVGYLMLRALPEPRVLDEERLTKGDVIVLLTAGMYSNAPEYGGIDTISGGSLFRARYAARLYGNSALPILVVGNRVVASETTEAEITAHVMREEFDIPVRWIVGEGRDTIESAAAVRRVLIPLGLRSIALVTTAAHMPRAEAAFRNEGFEVLPAPTGFRWRHLLGVRDFLPTAAGMSQSSYAIKEWLGLLWTSVRG